MYIMRPTLGFSSAVFAAILAMTGTGPADLRIPVTRGAPRKPVKRRRKTGWIYPHSSSRQQARYARQIARGQLSMAADKD